MSCPFCNADQINKQKIYETKTEYVLYNTRPANEGQCLVVPKRHVKNIRELTDNEVVSLIKTVRIVSSKIFEYLKPDGSNYGFNEGEYSGQMTEHFHFHIMPRFLKDKLPEFHLFHRNPKIKRTLSDEELKSFVEKFRSLFLDQHVE